MTISSSQILDGITEAVSVVDAAIDDGLPFIPELAIVKPFLDALSACLTQVAKINASNASAAAKLAAGQVAVADAAASTAETLKFDKETP